MNGQVLLGSASGNSSQDPLPQEGVFGGTLGLHRTYWQAAQRSRALDRARLDLQQGRLPWISFKTPVDPATGKKLSWAQMAAGEGDAWARSVAADLAALPGPVWVAVHHEPENDPGDMQDWKRMQQHLAPIFRASPNVAFTVIFMGYHQFAAPYPDPKLSMEAMWPGAQYVDVTGFDPYNNYGTLKSSGKMDTNFMELKSYYDDIVAWSDSVGGAPWAIAETGLTDLAAEVDVKWLSRAYDDMKAAGGVALTYWDNQFDGPATSHGSNTWRLATQLKQDEFASVLARSDRLTDPDPTPTPEPTPEPSSGSVPVAPDDVTAQASGMSSVELSWSPVADATGYTVRRDGSWLATTDQTSLTDSGLAAGSTHTYVVKAYNAKGISGESDPVTVTTDPKKSVPPPPDNVTAKASGTSAVTIEWAPVGAAAGYTVRRDGSWLATTDQTSLADSGLTADSTYTYVVKAYNAKGISGESDPVTVTTKPKRASVTLKAKRSADVLRVNVDPNMGPKFWKFEVQRFKKLTDRWVTVKTLRTRKATEVRTVNRPKGKYRVRVLPKFGFRGVKSEAVRLKL